MAQIGDGWIACTYQEIPWQQQVRAGTREDRMVRSIKVCIPPEIAHRTFTLSSDLIAKSESAIKAIANLDNAYGEILKPLEHLLIRTESIASSKIENLFATSEEYAQAQHGNKSNSSAVAMVAGTHALATLIASVDSNKTISDTSIKMAHQLLMKDVPREQDSAGTYRRVQNWIDGSNHSPLGAIFVPPPPEMVKNLMQDLLKFANRDDVPALAQAAIAHAQFETIHPFTDGNGRIGRALINAILRRRMVTTRVIVPIASSLAAQRTGYFEDLSRYRTGHFENLLIRFADASIIAASEASTTAKYLAELPATWKTKLGIVRSGGSTSKLLEFLISNPVFSAEELIGVIGKNPSGIYRTISKLQSVGILVPVTTRKRNQIWASYDVLQELDDLDQRIALHH